MNDDHQPRYEHELTLAPLPTEVRRARRFARLVLQERRIAPERIGTAELLVSELVTNAIKMTRITKLLTPYRTVHDHFRLTTLRLSLVAGSVVIEVRDSSDNPPVLQEQCLDSEDGRGLAVVESMSSQWNYFRLTSMIQGAGVAGYWSCCAGFRLWCLAGGFRAGGGAARCARGRTGSDRAGASSFPGRRDGVAGQAGAGRAHSRCQQARKASFQGQVRLIFSTRCRA